MFQRDISLYAKYPDLKSRYKTLLGPLNFAVWMAVLASVTSAAFILLLLNKYLGKNQCSPFVITVPSYNVLINEAMPLHFMYANMSVSKWFLLSFLIPMNTLLSHGYRSNLLASLIEHEHDKPVDTYQDIIDRDLTIYIINGTTVPPLLANSPNPTVVQAYWNNMIGKNGIYASVKGETPARVWRDLDAGKGIIVRPKERESLYIRRGKHLNVGSFICGYYLNMGHPLNAIIRKTVQTLFETGVYTNLVEQFVWARKAHLRHTRRMKALEKDSWTKLENGHIMPVYLMSALLLVLSCLIFTCNLYILNFKGRTNHVKKEETSISYKISLSPNSEME